MSASPTPADSKPEMVAQEPVRRGFLYKIVTIVVSAALFVVPVFAAFGVFFDPLRSRKRQVEGEPVNPDDAFVRITSLGMLPADGVPRPYTVKKDSWDGWTFHPDQRVGTVYLRRLPDSDDVVAFNAECPHAGCMVSYRAAQQDFRCPCHDSAFQIDGERVDPLPGGKTNPAPRGLDHLETRVSENGDIEVKFQNFYTGRHEAVPVACSACLNQSPIA